MERIFYKRSCGLTKEGLINGVKCKKENGREYLKSNPNGTEEDNFN